MSSKNVAPLSKDVFGQNVVWFITDDFLRGQDNGSKSRHTVIGGKLLAGPQVTKSCSLKALDTTSLRSSISRMLQHDVSSALTSDNKPCKREFQAYDKIYHPRCRAMSLVLRSISGCPTDVVAPPAGKYCLCTGHQTKVRDVNKGLSWWWRYSKSLGGVAIAAIVSCLMAP